MGNAYYYNQHKGAKWQPCMMNIYCTKIKLRAAAHQSIYLLIFH